MNFYKKYKKLKFEESLEELNKHNNEMRNLYRSTSQEFEFPDNIMSVYKMYSNEYLKEVTKKYNVNKDTVEKAKYLAKSTEEEFEKMMLRVKDFKMKEEKKEEEKLKREKIELYKIAIKEVLLEMKAESEL